jgi:hypothetical protein
LLAEALGALFGGTWASLPCCVALPCTRGWATIMPAPTVPLVRRSMTMNAPVVRLLS